MEYTKDEAEELLRLDEQEKKVDEAIDDWYMCHNPPTEERVDYDVEAEKAYEDHIKDIEQDLTNLSFEKDSIRHKRFKVIYGALAREKKDIWHNEAETFVDGKIVNEVRKENGLIDDVFSRKKKAEGIADILCKPELKSPYNIAIVGDWGTGKTCFCNYIKQSIKERNEYIKRNKRFSIFRKDTYKVIDFNAAEYSSKVLNEKDSKHVEQQWSNLMRVLFENYEKEYPLWGLPRYNFKRLNWRLVGRFIIYCFSLLIIAIPTFLLELLNNSKNLSEYKTFFDVGWFFLGVAAFIPLFLKAINMSIPMAKKVGDKLDYPNYIDVLGTRERITSDVETLIKSWVKGQDKRIIIFVDDCDRCSTTGIMELFEAMHLFLDLEKIFFVFAIDYKLLNSAVAEFYKSDESDELVERFLQKYISRTVPLEKSRYSKFIKHLAMIIEPNEENKHCLTSSEYEQIAEVIESENNTPRDVTQMINNIVTLKNYYMADKEMCVQYTFQQVLGWYMFNHYYVYSASKLRKYFTEKYYHYTLDQIAKQLGVVNTKFRENASWIYISSYYVYDIVLIEQNMEMFIKTKPLNEEKTENKVG